MNHLSKLYENMQKFIIFSLLGIYGITVVLSYLVGSLLAPNLSTLSCVRGEPPQFSCELISSGIFGTYTTHIPSGQIQSAEVDERCDGGDCSYEVILKTTRGKISLAAGSYSYESDAQENINRINLFIKNKEQKTLILRKDERWKIIYTVIIWGALIFFLIFSSQRTAR